MKINPNPNYKPSFSESKRQRPLRQRLTPLAWSVIAVVVFLAVGSTAVLAVGLARAGASQTPLAEVYRPVQTATLAARPVTVARASPTSTPTPRATPSPRAPWADRMRRMPDGTWMAPDEVVRKAIRDQNEAYRETQARGKRKDAAQYYLSNRESITRKGYIGEALDYLLQVAEVPTMTFGVNTGGTWLIEVKDFSEDGLTAKMGVVQRNWTFNLYDNTGKLIKANQRMPDALNLFLIRYDPSDDLWKIEKALSFHELPK